MSTQHEHRISCGATKNGVSIDLRKAAEDDGEAMFAWQCEPSARRFARNPATPDRDGHFKWLRGKLADPDCLFWVIEAEAVPCGIVRLDRLAAFGHAFVASILVASAFRNMGIGKAALTGLAATVYGCDLLAEIMPGNGASIAAFESAGFRRFKYDWFVRAGNRIGIDQKTAMSVA